MTPLTALSVLVAMVAWAPAADAAIPIDAARTWKTNPEAYRSGFAAGGADMLAVLASDFQSRSAAVEQKQIRAISECLKGTSSVPVLRGAVDAFIGKTPLPPPPHSARDFPVVAADVSDVLLECSRSAPAPTTPPRSTGYRAASKLRIGGVGARAVHAYVTVAEWGSAATLPFRNGYVAGAANALQFVAGRLETHSPHGVRREVQQASECVRGKYTVLDALRRSLDAHVDKGLAGGHNYTAASTLSVLLIDCP